MDQTSISMRAVARSSARAFLAMAIALAGSVALMGSPAHAANSITWDTPHSYTPNAQGRPIYAGSALSENGTTAFRYWTQSDYSTFNVALIDLSGDVPDYGPTTQPAPLAFGSDWADASRAALSGDGSTVVVAQVVQISSGDYDYMYRIAAGQISGTTIDWGPSVEVARLSYSYVPRFGVALDRTGTKGVLLTTGIDSVLMARDFSVSGNSVTMGNVSQLDDTIGTNGEFDVAITPDGDKAVARWSVEGSPWQMEAAKATRSNGDLAWTALDTLPVPAGYIWQNPSDSQEAAQLALSDDGSRAAVALAPIATQARAGLWGLNTQAAPGSQWTDVAWIAASPGEVNSYTWAGDISADGTTLVATASGTTSDSYVLSRKYDGSTLSDGSRIDLVAPASEWTEEKKPWISMDAQGTSALLAFTASNTQGNTLPIDLDPTTAVASQDNTQIQTLTTTNQSYLYSFVDRDFTTQMVGWVDVAAGAPYNRVGTSRTAPTVTAISPDTGSSLGGTAVTITGTGFLSDDEVTIGGSAATDVVVVDATTITATTPAGSVGTADVVVTNRFGQEGTGSGLFTYEQGTPAPTLTNVAPAAVTTAGGVTVTLTGTDFVDGSTTVSVAGQPCTNVVVSSPTTLTCTVPAHAAGQADVVVTTPGGSTAPYTNFEYVEGPTPSPLITDQPADAVKDKGETATFEVAASGSGSLSYQWQQKTPSGAWETIAGATAASYTTGTLNLADSGTEFRVVVTNTDGSGTASVTSNPASLFVRSLRAQPVNPPLRAGRSLYTVDGQPAPVNVTPNKKAKATGLDVTAAGLTMDLEGRGDDSDPLGLTPKQALILQSTPSSAQTRSTAATNKRVRPKALSSGSGFKANSRVKLYILDDIYLGKLPTNSKGSYNGSVPIPAGLATGIYTLQANGFAPDGSVRSLSLGVRIISSSTKKAQKPRDAKGKPPKRIALDGLTVLTGTNARTNAGQLIRTQARCTTGSAIAGEQRLCRVIRGKRGKVTLQTFGYSNLKVTLVQSAPATKNYRAYRLRTVYRQGSS